jgi:hypothetical protein
MEQERILETKKARRRWNFASGEGIRLRLRAARAACAEHLGRPRAGTSTSERVQARSTASGLRESFRIVAITMTMPSKTSGARAPVHSHNSWACDRTAGFV